MENTLPKNWVETTLGNVATFEMGQAPHSSTYNFEGVGVPLIKAGDWGKLYPNPETYTTDPKAFSREGDILICVVGATAGKINLGIDAAITRSVAAIRPFHKFIDKKYVYYFRILKYSEINSEATGSAQGILNKTQLSDSYFPLPPLDEQNRIVEKLDTLFAQLETIKTSMAKVPLLLKDFRQQVLTQAVTGKLTEEWRKGKVLEDVEDYILRIKERQEKEYIEQQDLNLKLGLKKTSKRDNKILPDSEVKLNIPINWRICRIADVISDLTDYHANGSYVDLKANVTLKEEPDYACMIRSTNFEKNNFESLMIYIDEHAYNFMSRSKLFGNEILISKIGNAGSVYFMPILNRPASLAMNLFALRIDKEIDSKYIYYHLISDFSSKNISNYVRGVATKSIDKISVRSLMIGLPSLKEQQEIVSRVESLFAKADAIEKQYETLKAKIDSLPQAILHKAFKGKLTEQLDSDGDAKELLREIEGLKKKYIKI